MNMKLANKEKFPIEIEAQGTVMDFVDDEFVFVIKDEEWTPFEIKALEKKSIELNLVCKYDITIFLLTVLDAIDTSDFVFNLHDNDYPDSLYTQTNLNISIYLIDKDNIIQAQHHSTLNKEATGVINETLKKVKQAPYMEAEFECNLEGLQSTWEPFEMQEFAILKEQI